MVDILTSADVPPTGVVVAADAGAAGGAAIVGGAGGEAGAEMRTGST